jgi:hypothetical protein
MFTTAGGVPVKHIAKWDGSNWSDVGGGADNYTGATTVSTFTVFNNELVVGGNIDSLGLIPVNYIGKWDGSTWTQLGSGTNNTVLALACLHDTLYAGGLFPVAGGNAAPFIAEWIPSPAAFISGTDLRYLQPGFVLYPNPADDQVYIMNTDGREEYTLSIYDMTGRKIMQEIVKDRVLLDRGKIPAGLYLYELSDKDRSKIQKGKLSLK